MEDPENRGYSVIEDGIKVPLPRYYRDRIFKEEHIKAQSTNNKDREIQMLKNKTAHEISENQRLKADRVARYARIINANDSLNRKI